MYEEEFMANLETPEQVRQKMAERLNELKQRREEERVDEVNRRLEQRFKDSKKPFSIVIQMQQPTISVKKPASSSSYSARWNARSS